VRRQTRQTALKLPRAQEDRAAQRYECHGGHKDGAATKNTEISKFRMTQPPSEIFVCFVANPSSWPP